MRILVLSIALVLGLSFTSIKKAEAGIHIISGAGSNGVGIALVAVGVLGAAVPFYTVMQPDNEFGVLPLSVIGIGVVGLGLIVLDVDGNIPQDELVTTLQKRWPFIDDREQLIELAYVVKEKAAALQTMSKNIRFTSEEVRSFFGNLALTRAEWEVLIADLK